MPALAWRCSIDVRANPIAKNVEDGLKVLRDGEHDGVIAFGGGSALDAAKVIAFMAGQTRPVWDFEDSEDWWTRADGDGISPLGGGADHRRYRLGSRPRGASSSMVRRTPRRSSSIRR